MNNTTKESVAEGFEIGKVAIIEMMHDKEFVKHLTNSYVETLVSNSRLYGETIGAIVNETISRDPSTLLKASFDLVEGVIDTLEPEVLESFTHQLCYVKASSFKFKFVSLASKFAGCMSVVREAVKDAMKNIGFRTIGVKSPTEPKEEGVSKEEFETLKKEFETLKAAYEAARKADKKLSSEYLITSLDNGDIIKGFSAAFEAEFKEDEFTGE